MCVHTHIYTKISCTLNTVCNSNIVNLKNKTFKKDNKHMAFENCIILNKNAIIEDICEIESAHSTGQIKKRKKNKTFFNISLL